MAKDQSGSSNKDEDLLAKAIPIDEIDSKEEDSPVQEAVALEDEEIALTESASNAGSTRIESFDHHQKYEEKWKRSPKKTGTGASHLRTFVSKLRLDAIEHLDEQVNQWLDEHPDYEVKLVSTSVGPLVGKLKEDALFMTVWV